MEARTEKRTAAVRPRLVRSYGPNHFVVKLGGRDVGSVERRAGCSEEWLYRSALLNAAGVGTAPTRPLAVRALVDLDARVVRPETLSVAPPIESFRSPGGRRFVVGDAWSDPRLVMPSWRHDFRIYLMRPDCDPKHVGDLYRSWNYGITSAGLPRWSGSLSFLRWQTTFDLPRGCGYDVAAFDTFDDALAAWARSADQILDHVKDKVA